MPVPEHLPHYRAYLLRFWAEGVGEGIPAAAWRFSLEDPRTGTRRGFADLGGLMAFLRAATAGRQGDVWEGRADLVADGETDRGSAERR